MNLSASTAPSPSSREFPGIVGLGSTDRANLEALLAPWRRPTPVTSATTRISLGEVHMGERTSVTEVALENYLFMDADLGVLRWDGPRGLLTFYSPTLIANFAPIRLMRVSPFTQYVLDRVLTPPIHLTLAPVLDATTVEQSIQPFASVLSSTDPLSKPLDFVRRKMSEAFVAAVDEAFEDGTESEFSRTGVSLLKTHGNTAVEALEALVGSPTTNPEVAIESLKWLGSVEHGESRQYRRTVLERLLESSSARIRYAAALALAAMDDPASLSAILRAIEHENHQRLRQYFQLVADQLEATRWCTSS